MLEQLHEEGDFLGRPLPVLAGKTVERKLFDAQPGTLFGDAADDAGAAAVAFDPRQPLAAGPAAVAVHDDGDVARHPLGRHVGQHERLRPGSPH